MHTVSVHIKLVKLSAKREATANRGRTQLIKTASFTRMYFQFCLIQVTSAGLSSVRKRILTSVETALRQFLIV
jgi:hypothetical protein